MAISLHIAILAKYNLTQQDQPVYLLLPQYMWHVSYVSLI